MHHEEDPGSPLVLQVHLRVCLHELVHKAQGVDAYHLADVAATQRHDGLQQLVPRAVHLFGVAGRSRDVALELRLLARRHRAAGRLQLPCQGLVGTAQRLEVVPQRLRHRQRGNGGHVPHGADRRVGQHQQPAAEGGHELTIQEGRAVLLPDAGAQELLQVRHGAPGLADGGQQRIDRGVQVLGPHPVRQPDHKQCRLSLQILRRHRPRQTAEREHQVQQHQQGLAQVPRAQLRPLLGSQLDIPKAAVQDLVR
mmetsp:Transcript_83807/g.201057  ORF Transcript_83807/g.201057 Transcript_83807/m.201057 type:complete len:253 (+) Transcript_83807:2514-3272(+)